VAFGSFFQSTIKPAQASSWHIECNQTYCKANYLHMQLVWKTNNSTSTLNGTLESVKGLPIDNEEFNIIINKVNSTEKLNIPNGRYLNDFIEWLGNIGYSQYKNNIDRYLAATTQTLTIYEQNQTDEYICAFLAYKFPEEISKLDFEINPPNKPDQILMFIKYLSFMDKSSNAEQKYAAASKAYIYLTQNPNEYNEYFDSYKNFVLNYTANIYYEALISNINAQLQAQRQAQLYKKMAKKLPLFAGLLAIVWIGILGYTLIAGKRKTYK
jgi:hypothetical protein